MTDLDLTGPNNSFTTRTEETPYQFMPPLSQEEFNNLKEDIRAKGVLVPIEYDENGKILDGHHRLLAVKELEGEGFKIPYDTVVRRGLSEVEKEEHVLTLNLKRRHLNNEQRVQLFIAMRARHMTLQQIADAAGLGIGTVWRATETFTKGNAPDTTDGTQLASDGTGIRDTIPQYVKGKDGKFRPTSYIRRTVIRSEEKDRLDRAAEREQARLVAPISLPDLDGRYVLLEGDFQSTGLDIPDGSLDAIITDPPYPEEYLPVYEALGRFAARTLRLGGIMAVMVGQTFLLTVLNGLVLGGSHTPSLEENLNYFWTMAYILPGAHSTQHGRKNFNGWKPILLFIKGGPKNYDTEKLGYFYDVVVGDGSDKNWHVWGQDLNGFVELVKRFTTPGSMVCDPFNGGGTTGIAALVSGRSYIGIDNDPAAIIATKKRIAEFPWDGITTNRPDSNTD